jgi:prophage regulatory protein
MKLLTVAEVMQKTTLSRSSIYKYMAAGHFPEPVRKAGIRRVFWLETDIIGWIECLAKESNEINKMDVFTEHL